MIKSASAGHKQAASPLAQAVYRVICYFDIFNYPLTMQETREFCSEKIETQELGEILNELVLTDKLECCDNYYFLHGKSRDIVYERQRQEKYLSDRMKKISRYARLVSKFPFVDAVFISGSVSKGVLSEDGDVDYFIVAKSRRVWLCRTLLVLYKKIFLLNSKKYFCVNYFVDAENLRVPDNNLFVATEIKTLYPVFNNNVSDKFFSANEWAANMFPNASRTRKRLFENAPGSFLKRLIERAFRGHLGEKLDNYFFEKTINHWRKKFPHFDESQFDLNMRSYKTVSKHHPQGNQARVLNELSTRVSNL